MKPLYVLLDESPLTRRLAALWHERICYGDMVVLDAPELPALPKPIDIAPLRLVRRTAASDDHRYYLRTVAIIAALANPWSARR